MLYLLSTKKGLATIAMAFLAQNAFAQQVVHACERNSSSTTVNGKVVESSTSSSCTVGKSKTSIADGQKIIVDGVEYSRSGSFISSKILYPSRPNNDTKKTCSEIMQPGFMETRCILPNGCIEIDTHRIGEMSTRIECPK